MSLNKYMHPRNKYKNAKPSFLDLALKYPEFRAFVTQDDSGKVLLDFKDAGALRALSTCLLKEDFGLTVELPPDRLVPTLPLRLNYIHWLEDIVGKEAGIWGIDIGTGASCIYPLLATKMNGWNFLATESDLENIYHAKKNVETNGFHNVIHVLQVTSEDALSGPIEKFTTRSTFDFCMCNPPFFADHMEAQAMYTSRSEDRPEPGRVSTASPQECIMQGGEVGFIRQMIEESTVLRDRIRVYTSMVGKKASLSQLKEELRHQKVPKFSTTEFCQGKTMRWGIAWTYDHSVTFPRSNFDARKEKPPLQFFVQRGAAQVGYNVHAIAEFLKNLLRSMKIHCYQGKTAKSYSSITLTALENTWCHQRRLRRQQQREKACEQDGKKDVLVNTYSNEKDVVETEGNENCANNETKSSAENPQEVQCHIAVKVTEDGKNSLDVSETVSACDSKKRVCPEDVNENGASKKQKLDNRGDVKFPVNEKDSGMTGMTDKNADSAIEVPISETDESPKEYILKCVMRLKRVDEQISLELDWLDGQSRELLHQVKTFLQNRLKVEPSSEKK